MDGGVAAAGSREADVRPWPEAGQPGEQDRGRRLLRGASVAVGEEAHMPAVEVLAQRRPARQRARRDRHIARDACLVRRGEHERPKPRARRPAHADARGAARAVHAGQQIDDRLQREARLQHDAQRTQPAALSNSADLADHRAGVLGREGHAMCIEESSEVRDEA